MTLLVKLESRMRRNSHVRFRAGERLNNPTYRYEGAPGSFLWGTPTDSDLPNQPTEGIALSCGTEQHNERTPIGMRLLSLSPQILWLFFG